MAATPDDFDASARPLVAMPARRWVMPAAIAGCVALGGVVFWQLNENRMRMEAQEAAAPQVHAQAPSPPPQAIPLPDPTPPQPQPEPPTQYVPPPAQDDRAARLSSRALVVDLSEAPNQQAAAAGAVAGAAGANARDISDAMGGAANDAFGQGSNEIFAARLGGRAAEARAQRPADLSSFVPEGAVIPAVLETALNSDLPGYTRAIVSRDLLSFDNTQVLVPRGSRLVGQYRSAVALGQSRAFVIWTRLIRPDGVNIALAAPGTDALGRGGLEGEVDTHFFRRFGGAILLSLVTAGVNAAAADSDTQVIIASTQGASGLTSELTREMDIPPTVDVAQGTPIRIFVTRDLDFSAATAP